MAEILLKLGLEEIIAKAAPVLAATRARAELIAERAREIAPVRTGAYRESIHVEQDPQGAQVVAGGPGVDYAAYIEVGTSDTPTFAPIRRAAEELT